MNLTTPPPYNLDAETQVLGACLIEGSTVDLLISEGLKAEHFYKETHRHMWRAFTALNADRKPIDVVFTRDQMSAAGSWRADMAGDLAELSAAVHTAANARAHAATVRRLATLRAVKSAAHAAVEAAAQPHSEPGKVASDFQTAVDVAIGTQGADRVVSVKQSLRELYLKTVELAQSGAPSGVSTGIKALDEHLGPLGGGEYVLLAARPAMGKTALGLQILRNVAGQGKGPCYGFSLEMPHDQLTLRMWAAGAGVNGLKLKRTPWLLNDQEWSRLTAATADLARLPLYYDSVSEATAPGIVASARTFARRYGSPAMIMLDYIQLVDGDRDSENANIQKTSRAIKLLALELDCPILVLAQLSRKCESRKDKRPMLSDLRDSGALEQDADKVMFLYRGHYYQETTADGDPIPESMAEAIIAKDRHGSTGVVSLKWTPEITTFGDWNE